MTIGLHAQSHHRVPPGEMKSLIEWIERRGHGLYLSAPLLRYLEKGGKAHNHWPYFQEGDIVPGLELIISLGGDGTILDSVLYALPNHCPILGINFGRLGFLAISHSNDFKEAIENVERGQFSIRERPLLEVKSKNSEESWQHHGFALNEMTITRRDSASMITVRTYLDGQFLNDYWGDGLILATETGSTGYSLSCGGPILWPGSNGMVITPISPHNLSMRPLVLAPDSMLEFIPQGRQQKALVSLDSRSEIFPMGRSIQVKMSHNKARFVEFGARNFGDTLREKLFWGKDLRN